VEVDNESESESESHEFYIQTLLDDTLSAEKEIIEYQDIKDDVKWRQNWSWNWEVESSASPRIKKGSLLEKIDGKNLITRFNTLPDKLGTATKITLKEPESKIRMKILSFAWQKDQSLTSSYDIINKSAKAKVIGGRVSRRKFAVASASPKKTHKKRDGGKRTLRKR
jgi:hypothetical protein